MTAKAKKVGTPTEFSASHTPSRFPQMVLSSAVSGNGWPTQVRGEGYRIKIVPFRSTSVHVAFLGNCAGSPEPNRLNQVKSRAANTAPRVAPVASTTG